MKHILKLLVEDDLEYINAELDVFDKIFDSREDRESYGEEFLENERKRLIKLKNKKKVFEEWLNEK